MEAREQGASRTANTPGVNEERNAFLFFIAVPKMPTGKECTQEHPGHVHWDWPNDIRVAALVPLKGWLKTVVLGGS
jgi:hypothetical protein